MAVSVTLFLFIVSAPVDEKHLRLINLCFIYKRVRLTLRALYLTPRGPDAWCARLLVGAALWHLFCSNDGCSLTR